MQRDLVLYWIEMAGQVVTRMLRLLGVRRGGVGATLRQEAHNLGVDLDLARTLDGVSLLNLLAPGGRADTTRCMLFGECLYVDGLVCDDRGDHEAACASYAKARLLLECAVSHGTAVGVRYPEIDARVAELTRRLDAPGPLPPPEAEPAVESSG